MTSTFPAAIASAVQAIVHDLPGAQVRSLAAAITDATGPTSASHVRNAIASPLFRDHADRLLKEWVVHPTMPGIAIAWALVAASEARERATQEELVDVVWTGPESVVIPVRRTREVLLELIQKARRRVLIVSFAAYKVPEVLEALAAAAARGVEIRLILETTEDSKGKLSHDAAAAFESLKAAAFYAWPAEKRNTGGALPASLHAKAVLTDGIAALVTSANLTGSAMMSNMELGLLVRGGDVPRRLAEHFDDLIARGELRRVV